MSNQPGWLVQSEDDLRRQIPVFVNSYEQLTYLRDTLDWFFDHGFCNITVLDQGSTYLPLLAHYARPDFRSRVRLLRFRNIGPRRAIRRVAAMTDYDKPFIFTDPDLELPTTPDPAFVTRLLQLGRHYDVVKVGLALDIHSERVNGNLPIGRYTIRRYYRRFFSNQVEKDVFRVGVDTTFFAYVPRPLPRREDILSSQPRIPALRVSGDGFLAQHRPWLFHNGMPPEEEAYYRNRTSIASTFFGRGQQA